MAGRRRVAPQSGRQSSWASGLQSGAAGRSHRGSSTPGTTGVAAGCAPGESTGLVRPCLTQTQGDGSEGREQREASSYPDLFHTHTSSSES